MKVTLNKWDRNKSWKFASGLGEYCVLYHDCWVKQMEFFTLHTLDLNFHFNRYSCWKMLLKTWNTSVNRKRDVKYLILERFYQWWNNGVINMHELTATPFKCLIKITFLNFWAYVKFVFSSSCNARLCTVFSDHG